MKIAVMGDIHENLFAFNLALEDAKKQGVEKYLFLGDYITDGDNPNEALDLVKKYGDYVIRGNREKYLLNFDMKKKDYVNLKAIKFTIDLLSDNNMKYIKSLKDYLLISLNGKKFLMIHGDQYYYDIKDQIVIWNRIIDEYPEFDICLIGHSHIFCDTMYKGKRFINPGAIGYPFDGPAYKYCVLNVDDLVITELREFSVADSYKELEEQYKKGNFYKENTIWGNVVLDTIRESANYFEVFIDIVFSKIDRDTLTSEIFNKR